MPGKCNGDNIISSKDSRGSSSKGQQGAVRPLCEMLEAICHAAAGKRRAAKREKAAARELERERERGREGGRGSTHKWRKNRTPGSCILWMERHSGTDTSIMRKVNIL